MSEGHPDDETERLRKAVCLAVIVLTPIVAAAAASSVAMYLWSAGLVAPLGAALLAGAVNLVAVVVMRLPPQAEQRAISAAILYAAVATIGYTALTFWMVGRV